MEQRRLSRQLEGFWPPHGRGEQVQAIQGRLTAFLAGQDLDGLDAWTITGTWGESIADLWQTHSFETSSFWGAASSIAAGQAVSVLGQVPLPRRGGTDHLLAVVSGSGVLAFGWLSDTDPLE